jgi:alcohol dehydrogenase class IV
MFSFEYEFRPKIIYGPGTVNNRLVEVIKELDGSKVAVVTDKGIVAAGLLDEITGVLDRAGLMFIVFDEVEPNPRNTTVDKGAKLVGDFGAQIVIGLGGGSSMDTAKAISVIMTNGGSASDYFGWDKFTKMPLPVICIPTTAGTGSEVTYASVVTVKNEKEAFKYAISSARLSAKVAILDPNLMLTAPPHVAAFCGMDALAHSVEAFFNLNQSPVSDVYAIEAMKLVNKHLRAYVANRRDMEAAGGMLLGSLLGGAAFSVTKTNLNHAMSHPMSAHFDVPHGAANAILTPHTMRFYKLADKGKFKKMAEVLGEDVSRLSDREASSFAIKAVEKLMTDLNIPTRMRDFGVTEAAIPQMIKDTLANPIYQLCLRQANEKDIENMYQQAF